MHSYFFHRYDPNHKKPNGKTGTSNAREENEEIPAKNQSIAIVDTANVENNHNPIEIDVLKQNKSTMSTVVPRRPYDFNSLPMNNEILLHERLNGITPLKQSTRSASDYLREGGSMISQKAAVPGEYVSNPEHEFYSIRQETKNYMNELFHR